VLELTFYASFVPKRPPTSEKKSSFLLVKCKKMESLEMTPCQYFPFASPRVRGTLCAIPDVCKGTLCARGKTVKQGDSSVSLRKAVAKFSPQTQNRPLSIKFVLLFTPEIIVYARNEREARQKIPCVRAFHFSFRKILRRTRMPYRKFPYHSTAPACQES